MSSLKKWREFLSDESQVVAGETVSVYCVPGLVEYVQDFCVDSIGRELSDLGPVRAPSARCLAVDGDAGFYLDTLPHEQREGIDRVAVSSLFDYGGMVCRMGAILNVHRQSGRLLWCEQWAHDGTAPSESDEDAAQAVALYATVFLQIMRRNRTRVEKVVTGNKKLGTAGFRGDAYVVRGISDVLTHYRKLDTLERDMTCGKQRWHMRRGHWVKVNTPAEYWRNPHEVGDERLGRIIKDYSLPEYQPRERES